MGWTCRPFYERPPQAARGENPGVLQAESANGFACQEKWRNRSVLCMHWMQMLVDEHTLLLVVVSRCQRDLFQIAQIKSCRKGLVRL